MEGTFWALFWETGIRRRTGVDVTGRHIWAQNWRRVIHIDSKIRRQEWTNAVTEWYSRDGQRSKGRPATGWSDALKWVHGEAWMRSAQDRETGRSWRRGLNRREEGVYWKSLNSFTNTHKCRKLLVPFFNTDQNKNLHILARSSEIKSHGFRSNFRIKLGGRRENRKLTNHVNKGPFKRTVRINNNEINWSAQQETSGEHPFWYFVFQ